ncbi:MAG TPA: hypothetical protein DDY71_05420 [Spirochaetia bacterium]|nr:hypothetical protein [Spirochaetia bacterium]
MGDDKIKVKIYIIIRISLLMIIALIAWSFSFVWIMILMFIMYVLLNIVFTVNFFKKNTINTILNFFCLVLNFVLFMWHLYNALILLNEIKVDGEEGFAMIYFVLFLTISIILFFILIADQILYKLTATCRIKPGK